MPGEPLLTKGIPPDPLPKTFELIILVLVFLSEGIV